MFSWNRKCLSCYAICSNCLAIELLLCDRVMLQGKQCDYEDEIRAFAFGFLVYSLEFFSCFFKRRKGGIFKSKRRIINF